MSGRSACKWLCVITVCLAAVVAVIMAVGIELEQRYKGME